MGRLLMTDHEYAQKVMKVAGVNPAYWHLVGRDGLEFHHPKWSTKDECDQWRLANGHGDYTPKASYPNPLTSGYDFLELIEALRERGFWVIATISDSNGSGYRVEIRRGFHGDGPYAWAETFQAALVEAAGQALGVSR